MLFKLIFKMLCIGAITAGGMTWLATSQGKDPMAYLSALDLVLPSAPKLPELPELPKMKTASAGTNTTVYRWTDANGVAQFSTSPPTQEVAYKTVSVNPNTNVVQAHKIVVKTESEDTSGGSDKTAQSEDEQEQQEESVSREDVGQIKEQLEQLKAANANRIENLDGLLQGQLN